MRPPGGEIALRLAALGMVALWSALAARLPETWVICGFRRLTGLSCPLCGMTRALAALAEGRWSEAVAHHALSPLVAALVVALPLAALKPAIERRAWQGMVVLLAVFGLLRLALESL